MFDPSKIDISQVPEKNRAHVMREAERIHAHNQREQRDLERTKDYAKERVERGLYSGLSRTQAQELNEQLNNPR